MSNLDFIPNLPKGPLDEYRQQASFNWKELKIIIERSPENLRMMNKISNILKTDPDFAHSSTELSVNEQKRRAMVQLHKLSSYKILPDQDLTKENYKKTMSNLLYSMTVIKTVMPDVAIKQDIGFFAVGHFIFSLGTEKHEKIMSNIWNRKVSTRKMLLILSAVAMTEVTNGSNTRHLRTTSTYDPKTQEFVLNTPDFLAAKTMIGNLSKTCTHALVFAQLWTGGECYGLHVFIVPIRDPKTFIPYPGLLVGDIGEKNSLNGVDNGFIMFKNYRIKRDMLLNRMSDVTPDGEFINTLSNPTKMISLTLEILIAPRIVVAMESLPVLGSSTVIAIRYAAIRKIFSSNGSETTAIINLQLHQSRVFPYLAASILYKLVMEEIIEIYFKTKQDEMNNRNNKDYEAIVAEIHAIVSSIKPLMTWTALRSTNDCREACGGHGYIRAANFGVLRDSSEAAVTYEGDNTVLELQTANWLIRQWKNYSLEPSSLISPLNTVKFLSNAQNILKQKCNPNQLSDILNEKFVFDTLQWLICWLVSTTEIKINEDLKRGKSKYVATSDSQVFKANILSKIFADYVVLFYSNAVISKINGDCRNVLNNLFLLYGLSSIQKYGSYFYQGQYTNSSKFLDLVQDGFVNICLKLKPEAVAIADALAPSDHILNSVLGTSDGLVYENLQRAYFYNDGAIERPAWWRDMTTSKL